MGLFTCNVSLQEGLPLALLRKDPEADIWDAKEKGAWSDVLSHTDNS